MKWPTCQERMVRHRAGERCHRNARFVVRPPYTGSTLVCGYHARAWLAPALRPIGKAVWEVLNAQST